MIVLEMLGILRRIIRLTNEERHQMKNIFKIFRERRILKEFFYNHISNKIQKNNGSKILIFRNTFIKIEAGSKIVLNGGILRVGTPCFHDNNGVTTLSLFNNSRLIVNAGGNMWSGSSINLISGQLSLGLFELNYNSIIRCYKKITIGNDVFVARNSIISDSDSHSIINCGAKRPNIGDVCIGNKVWICSNSVILKDTTIHDNCVIAANTLLIKKTIASNQLVRQKNIYDFIKIDGWQP